MDDDLDQAIEQTLKTNDRATVGAVAPDPLDAAVDRTIGNERTQRIATLRAAVPVAPEQAAQARSLAAKRGIPDDVILRNLKDVALQDAVDRADDRLLTSPVLADKVRDLSFARVSHGNIDNLADIEDHIRQYGELKAPESDGTIMGGLWQSFAGGARSTREGLRMQAGDALGLPIADAARRYAQEQARIDASTPEFESSTARGIYGGLSSTLRAAPGIAASILTRSTIPALAAMGAQTEAEAYGKYRTRGATPFESFVGAAGEGAVEVGTEALPMGFLVQRFGKVGAKEFLAGMLGREVPSEQVATLLQDAIDTAVANPEKTWGEYLKERPDAAYQTLLATLVQSSILGGASAATKRLARGAQEQQQSDQGSKFVADLLALGEQGDLRTLDPQAFGEMVQAAAEHHGAPTEVFIDANALVETLAQTGMTPEQIHTALPSAKDQLAPALAAGGDVSVPLGEFTALVSGQEFAQTLLQHVRTSPESLSQADAKVLAQTDLKAEGEKATAVDPVEGVRTAIMEQLDAAGRFSPQVNAAYAGLVSSFYATQAERLGTTPDELFKQYPLTIRAEGVPGAVLEQQEPTVEEVLAKWQQSLAHVGRQPLDYAPSFPGPTVLRQLGAGGKLSLPTRALQQIRQDHPDVPAKVFEDLPALLSDPLYVIPHRDGGWNVVIDARTEAGEPIVVGVRDGRVRTVTPYNDEEGFTGQQRLDRAVAAAASRSGQIYARNNEALVKTRASAAAPDRTFPVEALPRNRASVITHEALRKRFGDGFYQAGAVDPKGTFSPSTNTITLLAKADLSTFLHELGHHYLEALSAMASQPNAPAAIVEDMGKVLEWFGIKGATATGEGDLAQEGPAPLARIVQALEQFPSADPKGMEKGEFFTFMKARTASRKALAAELAPHAEGLMVPVRGGGFEAVNVDTRPDGLGWRITRFDDDMTPVGHDTFRTAEEAVATLINSVDLPRLKLDQADLLYRDTSTPGQPAETVQPQGTALATWRAMSLDQQRQYHEQFARGFEAYLFEGKAPDTGLTALFGRFRSWLVSIYRSIRALDVDINGEIRGVFDRLLATDEAIKQAEAAREYAPLFSDAAELEKAGVDPAAYQALGAEATDRAVDTLAARSMRDMRWMANAKNRALAALQKEVAGLRKVVEDEVSAEVDALPIEKARNAMKTDGATLDAVADAYGFTSGEALAREMVEQPKRKDLIQAMTDQRMLERHGELNSPQGLERAAEEAIHNEVRGRFIATELSALDKAIGPARVLVAAAKQFAEAVIGAKTLRDIKAAPFLAAETRAARLAEKSLGKSIPDAAAAKRNQLLNHYAAQYAHEAAREVEKIRAFFTKVASTSDDRLKSRDLDVVNAARAILAAYGIGRKGDAAGQYLEAVERYDPDMSRVLRSSVDAALANAKPLDELTLTELRALNDEVASLWHLAKRSRQMEVDGDLLDREEVQGELAARMKDAGIPPNAPGETSAPTPGERRLNLLRTYLAAARRVESWVGQMDGKDMGPFRRFIWQVVKEPADAYRADQAKYLKAFRDLLVPIADTLKRRLIESPELGYTFGKDEGGVGLSEVLHAILHTGNSSNKRKLLLGRKWATENPDGTLDTSRWDRFIERLAREGVLTKAHFDFVQGVWDLLEQTKPLAQKTHRDVFGKYFAEVTAEPVRTPFGEYRGGYAPAIADPRIVSDAKTRAIMEEENASLAFAFPTTNRGFTKGRTEYNRPLLLDLRTIPQHIDKVLLFAHMERAIRDVRRVLTAKEVAGPLDRIDPAAFDGLLTPWLNRAARQQVETPVPGAQGLMRFFAVLRARAGMAAMFGNVVNAAQQITGLTIAAVKVKPRYLVGAMADYLAHPRLVSQAICEASTYMDGRMRNEVAAMHHAIKDVLIDPTTLQSAQAWMSRHAYFLQSAVDNVIGPVVWLGARNQALEQGHSDRDAIRLADSAVRETQGSTMPEDISRMESGNAFVRMFTQFTGYFNMQANLLGTEFAKTAQNMGLRKGAGRGLYILALAFLVPAWVSELIVQAARGGPDDDDRDGYLDDWLLAVFGLSTLRGATALLPGVGPVLNAAANTANGKPYDDRISTSPAISMIESAIKAPSSLYKAITDEGRDSTAVRDLATAISMSVGLPVNVAAKPLAYGADVNEGRVNPTGPVDAVRGAITGRASPESAGR